MEWRQCAGFSIRPKSLASAFYSSSSILYSSSVNPPFSNTPCCIPSWVCRCCENGDWRVAGMQCWVGRRTTTRTCCSWSRATRRAMRPLPARRPAAAATRRVTTPPVAASSRQRLLSHGLSLLSLSLWTSDHGWKNLDWFLRNIF